MLRILFGFGVVFLILYWVPTHYLSRTYARTGGHEKRVTVYPGNCDDSGGWYKVDSDASSVTLACWEDDPR